MRFAVSMIFGLCLGRLARAAFDATGDPVMIVLAVVVFIAYFVRAWIGTER